MERGRHTEATVDLMDLAPHEQDDVLMLLGENGEELMLELLLGHIALAGDGQRAIGARGRVLFDQQLDLIVVDVVCTRRVDGVVSTDRDVIGARRLEEGETYDEPTLGWSAGAASRRTSCLNTLAGKLEEDCWRRRWTGSGGLIGTVADVGGASAPEGAVQAPN